MGNADAGTEMTLHSAAPTAILIAGAFMGHLLLVLFPKQARQPRTGVDGSDFLDWPDLRCNFNAQKRPGSFLCQVPDSAPKGSYDAHDALASREVRWHDRGTTRRSEDARPCTEGRRRSTRPRSSGFVIAA